MAKRPALNFSYTAKRAFRERFLGANVSIEDFKEISEYFGYKCLWCNISISRENGLSARQDHFQPIKDHGLTVPGNIVLSCNKCDDSRNHTSYGTLAVWITAKQVKYGDTRPGFSKEQINKRIDDWVVWKARNGKKYHYDDKWFASLPLNILKKYDRMLGKIDKLSTDASAVAEVIKDHVEQTVKGWLETDDADD